jgi:hypothetical protein
MRRKHMPRALLAATLAIGLIASGCGGDDDDESGIATSDLTTEEWIAQADEICAVGDRKLEREAEEVFAGHRPPNKGELAEFGREAVVPRVQDQVDQIRALGAPEGDEGEVEAILTAAEEALDEVRANPASLEGGGAFAEVNALAAEYGLDECAD